MEENMTGSTRPKVVMIRPWGHARSQEVRDLLENSGLEVEICDAVDEDEVFAATRQADGIIYTGPTSRRFLENLERCKVIARTSIGMDAIEDVPLATQKGIVLCNMPGVIEEEVADHTVSLALTAARGILPFDRYVREGRWPERLPEPQLRPFPRLSASTLGLIGFGGIGRMVAQRAQGFGMTVMSYDPFSSDEIMEKAGVIRARGLAELLQSSNIVSIHVPLNDATHHLIGAAELHLMRADAILVNTSRGPVVEKAALVEALRTREIAGAALDVMEGEPIGADDPLCALENVVLSPHIASRSEVTDRERHIRPAQEVAAVLAGHRPRAVWNRDVLEKLNLK